MRTVYTLYYGILASLIMAFFASLLQAYLNQNRSMISLHFLIGFSILLVYKVVLDKTQDESDLQRIENTLMIILSGFILFALATLVLSFVMEFVFGWAKIVALALGLPSVLALILRKHFRRQQLL